MSSHIKYPTKEEKLEILKRTEEGVPLSWICKQYGITPDTIYRWRESVLTGKEEELTASVTRNHYSEEFKQQVVNEYLEGYGSLRELKTKYGLRSKTTIGNWVSMYTEGKQQTSTSSGGKQTMAARKTTHEERIRIVKYCLENDRNYKQTAELFEVSYHQVHSWVKKFTEGGEQALEDRRGKPKEEDQLTPEDRLKRELRKVQKEKRALEVENAFLKKLEELMRESR